MVLATHVGGEVGHDGLADAIVLRFHDIVAVAQTDMHEPARREQRDELVGRVPGLADTAARPTWNAVGRQRR